MGLAEGVPARLIMQVQTCDWRGWNSNAWQLVSFLGQAPHGAASSSASGAGQGLPDLVSGPMLNCVTAWDSLYMPLPPHAVAAVARGHAADQERLVGAEGMAQRARFRQRWEDALFGGGAGASSTDELPAGRGGSEIAGGSGGAGDRFSWRVPVPEVVAGLAPGRGGRRLRVAYMSSHLNHFALGRDMLHVLRLHRRARVEPVSRCATCEDLCSRCGT